MDLSEIIYKIIQYGLLFLVFFISAIFHELGHGYSAYLLGDDTAKNAGRLTFNPFKHIDLFGTIIFPIMLTIAGFFPLIIFKPVPINENNFKNPQIDSVKVALSGPGMNLMLIIITVVILNILKLFGGIQNTIPYLFFKNLFAQYLILINLILMIFNLMPIPPLDGSWVVRGFLPPRWRYYYQKSYTYLVIIFIILIISGKFRYVFIPFITFFEKIVTFLIN